jgi:hypothetical protein
LPAKNKKFPHFQNQRYIKSYYVPQPQEKICFLGTMGAKMFVIGHSLSEVGKMTTFDL